MTGSRQVERRQIFGDVLGQRRNTRRLFGIGRIEAQHEAVVLDRRAAARGGDDDGIEPALIDRARPGVDILPRRGERLLLARPYDGPARRSSPRPAAPPPRRRAGSASEIVASLMPGSSTGWAQPVRMATRPRLAPAGAWRPGDAIGEAGGTAAGASFSIAASGCSAGTASNRPANGRPSFASFSAARNRAG